MKKVYVLLYADATGSRPEITAVLDKMKAISTWRYDIPNSIYIISEHSAQEIYEEFFTLVGKKGRYMFTEIPDNKQGQMTADTWHFINEKSHKPKV